MAQFGGNVNILAKHFIFLLKFCDFVAKYEDLLHQKIALNLSNLYKVWRNRLHRGLEIGLKSKI